MATQMTAAHVINLVERLTYKPDWSFTTNQRYEESDTVRLTIHWAQRETNPYNAPGYEDRATTMEHTALIQCSLYTSEVDVMRSILEHCIKFELDQLVHEAREFFRVKPDMSWAAPFHPHHHIGQDEDSLLQGYNGVENWRETSFRQLSETRTLPEAGPMGETITT